MIALHKSDDATRWGSLLSSLFAHVEVDSRSGFECEISVRRSQSCQFTYGEGVAHVVRTKRAPQNSQSSLSLAFVLAGEMEIRYGDLHVGLRCNEASFVDLNRSYEIHHTSDFRLLTITLPEHAFGGLYRKARAIVGMKLSFGDTAFPIHMDYIQRLTTAGALAGAADLQLCETLAIRLLCEMVVSAGGAGDEPQAVTDKLAMIDRYLRTNVRRSDLTREAIAKAIGYSVRDLNRTLEVRGSSLVKRIKEHRLELAAEMLRNPNLGGLSITDVAFECGFLQSSTFARAFADYAGMPPRRYRLLQTRASLEEIAIYQGA